MNYLSCELQQTEHSQHADTLPAHAIEHGAPLV